jgi:hypothetical protein
MERRPSLFKRMISRPIPQRSADNPVAIGERAGDLERSISIISPQPPQVPRLNLDSQKRRSRLSWRLSNWRSSQDSPRQQVSVDAQQPSLISLNSALFNPHIWPTNSVYSRMPAHPTSSLAYSQSPYSVHNLAQTQPITWAQTVRESQRQKRHISSFLSHRPVPGIGHGQSFHQFDGSNHVHTPHSSVFSYSTVYSDVPAPSIQSHLPKTASHRFNRSLSRVTSNGSAFPPRRNSRPISYTSKSSHSPSSSQNERPVSRRDPYHSAFFASGQTSYHRRMSSAAGRRFAAVGLGLKTIDGSPALEAEGRDGIVEEGKFGPTTAGASAVGLGLVESDSQAWETTTSGETSERRSASPTVISATKTKGRPISGSVWRSETPQSQHAVGSRTSSVYSRNLDGSSILSGAPGPLQALTRSRSRSPQKIGGSKTPIMDRTRAHYRPWARRDREKIQSRILSTAEVIARRKANNGKGSMQENARKVRRREPGPDDRFEGLDTNSIAFI